MEIPKNRSANYEYRAEIFNKARNDAAMQAALRDACKADVGFWINTFVWVYEPRPEWQEAYGLENAHNPFILFDFQEELWPEIKECIEVGKDVALEKSRDMGLTWLVIAVVAHFWQFQGPGNDFLFGSRKAEYVDELGGPMSPLLPKVRYLLDRQPGYLKPLGYDREKHAGYMRIVNPETKSVLKGESNNPYFGSGGRYKAVIYDEFAKWMYTDEAAWQSTSDVTQCKIPISSANGKTNYWYKLVSHQVADIKVLTVRWNKHPFKDAEWYESEKKRRSPEDLAAEVNIDYTASVSNRAYEPYSADTHVKPVPYDPDRPFTMMCDFNIDPMCWAFSYEDHGMDRFFDEMVMHTTSTASAAQEFCRKFATHKRKELDIYGDATGAHRQRAAKGLTTDYNEIRRILEPAGWSIALYIKAANPAVSDRLKAVNKRLCDWANPDDNGIGKSWIEIDSRCRMLIESLEQTRRKEEGIDKSDNIEHITDGVGYKMEYKYPVIEQEITYGERGY